MRTPPVEYRDYRTRASNREALKNKGTLVFCCLFLALSLVKVLNPPVD